jgi:hypothetical protein
VPVRAQRICDNAVCVCAHRARNVFGVLVHESDKRNAANALERAIARVRAQQLHKRLNGAQLARARDSGGTGAGCHFGQCSACLSQHIGLCIRGAQEGNQRLQRRVHRCVECAFHRRQQRRQYAHDGARSQLHIFVHAVHAQRHSRNLERSSVTHAPRASLSRVRQERQQP